MIYVDASAFVAMLGREPRGEAMAYMLDGSDAFITSAMALWETAIALVRLGHCSHEEADLILQEAMTRSQIRVVDIGAVEAMAAVDAHRRFGKGRHPAQLNMGDCFAYAVAKSHKAAMLAVGDDFPLTDLKIVAY